MPRWSWTPGSFSSITPLFPSRSVLRSQLLASSSQPGLICSVWLRIHFYFPLLPILSLALLRHASVFQTLTSSSSSVLCLSGTCLSFRASESRASPVLLIVKVNRPRDPFSSSQKYYCSFSYEFYRFMCLFISIFRNKVFFCSPDWP